ILWFHMRRLMRAILTNNVRPPERVWDEHEAIWHAAYTGSVALAEELAKKHAEEAAEKLARIFLEQNKGDASSIPGDEIRYWAERHRKRQSRSAIPCCAEPDARSRRDSPRALHTGVYHHQCLTGLHVVSCPGAIALVSIAGAFTYDTGGLTLG